MKEKDSRLQHIRDLIENNNICSQSELVEQLAQRGVHVTQATLSRDLRRLRITKVASEEGYRYVYAGADLVHATDDNTDAQRHRAPINSIDFSGNFVVIKTRNGYATGLAYDIDMSRSPLILGTIAGADTVFAILREGADHAQVTTFINSFG